MPRTSRGNAEGTDAWCDRTRTSLQRSDGPYHPGPSRPGREIVEYVFDLVGTRENGAEIALAALRSRWLIPFDDKDRIRR